MNVVKPVRIFVLNGTNTNLYGLDPKGPYGSLPSTTSPPIAAPGRAPQRECRFPADEP